eukprot:TRINITY_DN12235_c0_g1_i2.p2 TRINITY_DN12235_c0_g1~~TRINITY_DN12235_c0_g1_i2.p2  ORF type:complete len:306 (-),score=56.53 TRINITY_DN12235_c0_g1_i2:202-1119(-)
MNTSGGRFVPLHKGCCQLVTDVPMRAACLTEDSLVLLSHTGRVHIVDPRVRVPQLPKAIRMGPLAVKQVACGIANTTLLTTEGAVFAFGVGEFTGLGSYGMVREPTLLAVLWTKRVKAIAAGAAHAAALTVKNQLFTWGKRQGPGGRDQLTCKIVGPKLAHVSRIACGPHCTIVYRSVPVDPVRMPALLKHNGSGSAQLLIPLRVLEQGRRQLKRLEPARSVSVPPPLEDITSPVLPVYMNLVNKHEAEARESAQRATMPRGRRRGGRSKSALGFLKVDYAEESALCEASLLDKVREERRRRSTL